MSLVSCDSSDKDKATTTDTTKETGESKDSTTPTVATVGETVQKTQLKITLLDAKVYDKVGFWTPAEGKKYLVLFFEAENISSNLVQLAVTNFEASINGVKANFTMLASKVDNYDTLSGGVSAGSKKQGYSVWEIGSNYNKLEISYKDGYLSSNSYMYDYYSFIVKPENITNYND